MDGGSADHPLLCVVCAGSWDERIDRRAWRNVKTLYVRRRRLTAIVHNSSGFIDLGWSFSDQ